MGYYIKKNSKGIQLPATEKANALVSCNDAIIVDKPNNLSDIPESEALLCCVENGGFDAIGLAYSESELKIMTDPTDKRKKTWLLMNKTLAYNLANFKQFYINKTT